MRAHDISLPACAQRPATAVALGGVIHFKRPKVILRCYEVREREGGGGQRNGGRAQEGGDALKRSCSALEMTLSERFVPNPTLEIVLSSGIGTNEG